MSEGVVYTGIPSVAELAACPGIPTDRRMRRGRVAVIECVQQIPCNPCEGACRFGAIEVGAQITDLPRLIEDKCTGCGLCVAQCPGLAIILLDLSGEEAYIEFPFEYLPLPAPGERVEAVDRAGTVVCAGTVESVRRPASYAGTAVVGMRFPAAYAQEVRSIKRLTKEADAR